MGSFSQLPQRGWKQIITLVKSHEVHHMMEFLNWIASHQVLNDRNCLGKYSFKCEGGVFPLIAEKDKNHQNIFQWSNHTGCVIL